MINISILDTQKLIDAIEKKRAAGRKIDYLIMSKKTLDAIAYKQEMFMFSVDSRIHHNFQGIEIAICEGLNFGDVDFVESMR